MESDESEMIEGSEVGKIENEKENEKGQRDGAWEVRAQFVRLRREERPGTIVPFATL